MQRASDFGTLLFDLDADPEQQRPMHDPEIETRMTRLMVDLMKANDAPADQYKRLGLCALMNAGE